MPIVQPVVLPVPGPRDVRSDPVVKPTLTHLAGTPALRLFEFSENRLQDLTWDLSDWDRAILDGDIQRALNNEQTSTTLWTAPNSGAVHTEITTGSVHQERQALQVRRLHILNQTPVEVTAAPGEWRSWSGALLHSAPTSHPSKVIGRLAPTTKTQVLAQVTGIDGKSWMLIGYRGIGMGYVARNDLKPIDKWTKALPGSAPSFNRAVNLDFTPTLRDHVYATVPCRSLSVGAVVDMSACKGLDGRWRVQ